MALVLNDILYRYAKEDLAIQKLNLFLILGLVLVSTVTQAGTLQRTDPDSYKYAATTDGVPSYGTIYGHSTLYGYCNYGCVLKLIDSGQTIEVQADDNIIIDNAELKRQDN